MPVLSSPIQIRRDKNLLFVSPVSLHSAITPHLTWHKRERHPKAGQRTGGVFPGGNPKKYPFYTTVDEPMFKITDNEVITWAGFLGRLQDLLKPYGEVQYVDNRPAFPEPDRSVVGKLRYKQDDALEAIWKNDGGLIDCVTAFGKTQLIVMASMSYPGLDPALIVGPDKACVENIRQRFGSYGIETGWVDGSHDIRRRITICTAPSLMKLESTNMLSRCRLLFFDEVHRAVAPTTRAALIRAGNARMFGLTASVDGRADQGEIVVEGLFGRTICRVDYQEAVDAEVVAKMYVIMVDTPGCQLEGRPDVKSRHGLWRNRARNEMFAGLATQLRELGQTLLMVDTLEHGLNLRHFLSEQWPLAYGVDPRTTSKRKAEVSVGGDPFASTSADRAKDRQARLGEAMDLMRVEHLDDRRKRELVQQFTDGRLTGAVATHVWSTGVDFPNLQFLIRADGMASAIQSTQAPGRATRRTASKTVGIIIDGEDMFDTTLNARKMARLKSYAEKGWTVLRHKQAAEVPTLCQQIISQSNVKG